MVPLLKGILEMDGAPSSDPGVLNATMQAWFGRPNESSLAFLVAMAAFILMAIVIKNIMILASDFKVYHQVSQYICNLRKVLFLRYLSFGNKFHDQSNVGHLAQTVLGSTQMMSRGVCALYTMAVILFRLAVYFVVMLVVSWQLTFAVILIFLVLHFSVRGLIRKIKHSSTAFSTFFRNINASLISTLSCLPLVRAQNNEKDEYRKFAALSEQVAETQLAMDKKQILTGPVQEILTVVLMVAFVTTAAFLHRNQFSGLMASFLIYFYILQTSLRLFRGFNLAKADFAKIHGPLNEFLDVIDDHDKSIPSNGSRLFTGLQQSIRFSHLNFSYTPGVPVLRGVNLEIRKGQITVITGSTGAGKTTLVSLLLRFYDCPPDSLFIDGRDIKEFNIQSLREEIAWVSQDQYLFHDTIRANLLYGVHKNVSDEVLADVLQKARLDEWVQSLPNRLETRIGDQGIKLSGGEKQRLSIARAMLKNAQIIILDEATSSLDTHTEKLIQDAIEELAQGRTTVAIALRLSTMRRVNQVIVLEKGEVVETGSPEELLQRKGRFYDLRAVK